MRAAAGLGCALVVMLMTPTSTVAGASKLPRLTVPPSPAAVTEPAEPPKLDARAIEAWVDARVLPAMKQSGAPGMVVVIVRREGVVLSKGYGVANIASGTPVLADRTLFDIASIGKSMTAVVTETLIDQGRLDLDQDANQYLKSARVTGPKVTLRMLLGHRGGFDNDLTGLFSPIDGDVGMSRGELDRRLKPVFKPDSQTGYDNQGYGLIGLILRDVTREPLNQLYRERLFGPAGMTSAVQGQPPDGKARIARCYVPRGPGKVRECPFWLYREALRGAGGVLATGDDMGRYMRMLLGGGTVDGQQVLSPRAFADLTDFSDYRFNPGLPGFARSFTQFESFRGLEYAHGGEMPGFTSILQIYPDADIGIFVSVMGGQLGSFDSKPTNLPQAMADFQIDPQARKAFFKLRSLNDDFAEQFIPAAWPRRSEGPAAWKSAAPDRIDPYLGRYVLTITGRTQSIGARLLGLLSAPTLTVVREGSSGISVVGLGPYRHIGPDLYEDPKGRRIAFATLPGGRFMAVHLSPAQFRKTNWIDTPTWTLPLIGLALLIILTGTIQLRPGAPQRLRRLAIFSLGGLALAVVGVLAEWQWGVALAVVKGDVFAPAVWRLALHIGAVLLVWTSAAFFFACEPRLGRIGAAHGALIALADLSVVIVLLFWRLLAAFPPWISW
jgi:CubicO group peptidase (beta-lactamase class C family)